MICTNSGSVFRNPRNVRNVRDVRNFRNFRNALCTYLVFLEDKTVNGV